jgi:hypothetical protein
MRPLSSLTLRRLVGPDSCSSASWWRLSSSDDARAVTRREQGLRLWLLLLAVMLTVVPLTLMPRAMPNRLLLSTSTSVPVQMPKMSLVSLQLCDSQQATTSTDPSTTTTTVGVPCEPTDVVASQSEYLGLVIASLLLFGVFFLIGFKVWT